VFIKVAARIEWPLSRRERLGRTRRNAEAEIAMNAIARSNGATDSSSILRLSLHHSSFETIECRCALIPLYCLHQGHARTCGLARSGARWMTVCAQSTEHTYLCGETCLARRGCRKPHRSRLAVKAHCRQDARSRALSHHRIEVEAPAKTRIDACPRAEFEEKLPAQGVRCEQAPSRQTKDGNAYVRLSLFST